MHVLVNIVGYSVHRNYHSVHTAEIVIVVCHSIHDPTCVPSTIYHVVFGNALWVILVKYDFSEIF